MALRCARRYALQAFPGGTVSSTILALSPRLVPVALRRYASPPRADRRGPLQVLALCLVESRPTVQVIFLLRFLAGAALGGPGTPAGQGRHVTIGATVWFCLVSAIYLLNGASDVIEDRCNGSKRPIARGRLPVQLAIQVAIAMAVLGLGLSTLVPGLLPLAAGQLLLGLAYSTGPVPLKRWPLSCTFVVVAAGILTYVAGDIAAGGSASPRLVVHAAAMSAWMAVGGLAKDLSDVAGDRVAGRRTCSVVLGETAARLIVSATAMVVAGAFLLAVLAYCPSLLTVSGLTLAGAVVLSAVALTRHSRCGRARQRRPYRMFALTQFAAHLTCLVVAIQ